MKFILTILLTALASFSYSQKNIDVLHYKYEIELSDRSDSIYGKASVTIRFPETVDSFTLDLKNSIASSKKGMTAFVMFGKVYGAHAYQKGDKLFIIPGHSIKKGDERTFDISYSGIPSDGLIISKNKYGNRTFFADNWPNRAHNWIPCNDDPADKASVEFVVIAPSHYQVVSNGLMIEESNLPDNKKLTHYKEDIELPTKVMVIGVADFAVNRVGDIGCIPVYSWVFPENREEGFTDYAMAKDILNYHINYIGPYAYKKLANIQSKTIFGGMENAGAIFYAESSVTGNRYDEELLSHEIVHQWFGDMATEKSFAHLWLSEGFATYLTHLYMGSKYGEDSLNHEMRDDRNAVLDFVKASHRPVVDSVADFMKLLNANSYQKGSWVLHMLRRELGDSIFHQSIRLYYSTYAGKNAETKDLQQIFETVSGKDLEQFFQQWLFRPVNPILKISWQYLVKEKKMKVDITQLQEGARFVMPLELELRFSGGKKITMPFDINAKIQSFSWEATEKPLEIIADPKTSLLFEADITEKK